MKKKYYGIMLAILILSIAALAGCGAQAGELDYVSEAYALEAAMEVSGLDNKHIESKTIAMKSKDGIDYYQISLKTAGNLYEYDINALTGTIIEQRLPWEEAEKKPDVQKQEQGKNEASAAGNPISLEEAKAIALGHAGLGADQVTFAEAKKDWDDGKEVYDIEFYTADYKEYDYEIEAASGKILGWDYDAERYERPAATEKPTPANPPAAKKELTADEAKAIALAKVPGATKDNIRDFEVDRDDGRLEYEGEIVYDGMEYEFEIDAYSGAIRSWEAEPAGW